MKILHWAIILVIIVLPISLICRINVNAKFTALKDEVRINNAIDTATKDAIDQIIAVNESITFDNQFGDVIDITPAFAEEMVDTFFHSMAVNYNIPYQESDFSSGSEDSYIKNYFSSYIPAIVIVAYDGFYIYSLENNGDGYKYEMSSKIPYACEFTVETQNGQEVNYTVGYTLGRDIYLYYDGKCYSGRLTDNSSGDTEAKFNTEGYRALYEDSGSDMTLADFIASFSNDMSLILYALHLGNNLNYDNDDILFDNSIMPSPEVTNFLDDYKFDGNGRIISDAGDFETKKKEVIIDIITSCLNEEINIDQNRFADLVGITYDFKFPTLSQQDWINTIDDISFLAFVQGIPIGNAEGVFYNNFALGGSKIVETGYIYITENDETEHYYYHNKNCKLLGKDGNGDVDYGDEKIIDILLSKPEAIANYNAYPCLLCN